MQQYSFIFPKQPNSLDSTCYMRSVAFSTPHYQVTPIDEHSIIDSEDVIVYSANAGIAQKLPVKNKAVIVSYIPDPAGDNWLSFYANIWQANIVVCDSFVYNKGAALFEGKRWVNLDAAIIPAEMLIIPTITQGTIAFIGEERTVIACMKYINTNETWKEKDYGLTAIEDATNASYVIAMRPIGYMLASTLTAIKDFVWLPANETTYLLDSRYTHPYAERINQYTKMVGGGGAQKFTEHLDVMFEEFITLALHNNTSEHRAKPFRSNTTIFDRIFHELNRSK